MLLMVEKAVRGEICHTTHRYAIANSKYMNGYDKNKELSYLKYWDINNAYEGKMYQKLPLGGFRWVEVLFQFNEDFIKSYNEDSNVGYFF